MKVQITQKIARRIFEYYEADGLENVIMISKKSKRITFDNFFYRDKPDEYELSNGKPDLIIDPLFIVVKKYDNPETITFIYKGEELTVDECFLVYKDRTEKISMETMRIYFVEEIINETSLCEGFEWEYK